MNKPESMSIKEWIIKNVSKKLMIPEKTINVVITHQFDSASEALKNKNSVELYEFGKFLFKEKRARYFLEKTYSKKEVFTNIMNDESVSEKKRKSAQIKLEEALKHIKYIEFKLNINKDEN